jgi:hypothetical protein
VFQWAKAMVSVETISVIERAKAIYESRLRNDLEASHIDQYVAIEPDSGEYFVACTFDDAVRQARAVHPTKLAYTVRIGHAAALHIGLMMQ